MERPAPSQWARPGNRLCAKCPWRPWTVRWQWRAHVSEVTVWLQPDPTALPGVALLPAPSAQASGSLFQQRLEGRGMPQGTQHWPSVQDPGATQDCR